MWRAIVRRWVRNSTPRTFPRTMQRWCAGSEKQGLLLLARLIRISLRMVRRAIDLILELCATLEINQGFQVVQVVVQPHRLLRVWHTVRLEQTPALPYDCPLRCAVLSG